MLLLVPTKLAALQASAAANTPQWAAFKANLDKLMGLPAGPPTAPTLAIGDALNFRMGAFKKAVGGFRRGR